MQMRVIRGCRSKHLLYSICLAAFTISCQSKSVDLVESASHSVVKISVPALVGNDSFIGSGFFIDSLGTIATCYHVLFPHASVSDRHKKSDSPADTSKLMLTLMNGSTLMTGNVFASDSSNDIALIRASNSPATLADWGVRPVQLSNNELPIRVGSDALCIGATVLGGYGIGSGRIHGFHVNKGIVSMLGENYRADGELRPFAIVLDLQILGGQSGGPVFDLASGCAIGMITGSDQFDYHGSINDPGTTVCTPIHKIMKLYRSANQH